MMLLIPLERARYLLPTISQSNQYIANLPPHEFTPYKGGVGGLVPPHAVAVFLCSSHQESGSPGLRA